MAFWFLDWLAEKEQEEKKKKKILKVRDWLKFFVKKDFEEINIKFKADTWTNQKK